MNDPSSKLPPVLEYAPPESKRRARVDLFKKIVQHLLILAGLLLFAHALTVPGLLVNGFNGYQPLSGAWCLVVGVYWYPSNAWLLLAPLVAWVSRKCRSRIAYGIIALLSLLALAVVLVIPMQEWTGHAQDIKMVSGTYFWVGAHCCVTLALLIPFWDRRIKSANRRSAGTWPPQKSK